jgi:peptidoglycan/xylan/chitin deacetylase (PgdA/CDA1 family)
MYHDLVESKDNSAGDLSHQGKLSRAEFENHLLAIKNCCRCLTVEEVVGEIKNEGGLKENTISITFDDGYLSVYDTAFPLLKKHGLSATIYLLTDWINGNLSLWWEDLNDMVLGFQLNDDIEAGIVKIGDELKIEQSRYMVNDRISKESFLSVFSHELMKSSDDRKKIILDELRDLLFGGESYKRAEVRPVTWEQAREMADAGIMFGAHTCSHVNLSYVDIETARDEIIRSKKEMENRLGREIRGFAYPYGYDVAGYARFIPLLKEIGFDYACTSWWGNNSGDSNLFQLLRNHVPPLKSRLLLKRELYIDLSE